MTEAETVDGAGKGEEDENTRLFKLDPFVQPPILKALFEQLPLEDLAKCRLVSKLWCKESLSTWRSNATLKIGKEGLVSRREDGSKRITSLGEFLDLWVAGEWVSCPFKKYSLSWWNFKAGDGEQQRFMELMGGHLTSLTFEKCSFVGRDNFRRIMYQAFPKLQFLKMEGCEVDNDYRPERREDVENWDYDGNSLSSDSESDEPSEEVLVYKEPAFGVHGLKSLDISDWYPDSVMDMLSHFHKLNSLSIGTSEQEDYWDLFEAIKLIREQDQTKLPLKNFDVKFAFHLGKDTDTGPSIELLKLHEQLSLPLQRLEITFYPEEAGDRDRNLNHEDVIRDILQYHSSTLKNLEFCKFPNLRNRNNHQHGLCKLFPYGLHLEKLKKMVLQSRSSDNLSYLMYMPNLSVLRISDAFGEAFLSMTESDSLFSNSSELEIGDWTLPSLTDLAFGVPLSLCNLRKLMKWMPNVERLSGMKLDDASFALVCENWKNLKDLVDSGRELTDEGVIGIGNADEAGADGESRSCPNNITKLKSLTSFGTSSSKLTSASVHNGFLKLDNLQKVTLAWFISFSTSESSWIDNAAKAALERRKIRLEFENYF